MLLLSSHHIFKKSTRLSECYLLVTSTVEGLSGGETLSGLKAIRADPAKRRNLHAPPSVWQMQKRRDAHTLPWWQTGITGGGSPESMWECVCPSVLHAGQSAGHRHLLPQISRGGFGVYSG